MFSDGPPPSNADALEHLRQQFHFTGQLVPLLGRARKQPFAALFPFCHALIESTDSFLHLCERRKLRDCYILGRVIHETALNACFIMAGGQSAGERAVRHAMQRYIRALNRTVPMGEVEVQIQAGNLDEIMAAPHIQQLLAEFTTARGREVTSWTPENVRERTDVVYARYGSKAVGLLTGLWFYGNASEIIHGTLYGSLFAYGLDLYGFNPEEEPSSFLQRASRTQETLRLTVDAAVGMILHSFVRIVGGGLGQGALVRDSIKALRKFTKALATSLAALSSMTPNDAAAEPE